MNNLSLNNTKNTSLYNFKNCSEVNFEAPTVKNQ